MEFNETARIADLIAVYPWLPEEAAKMDPRLRIVNTPFGKALIRHATLGDASKRSGFPLEAIIEELKKKIAAHGDGNP